MSDLPLADRTITEVAEALRNGETSSRELTDACLERIDRHAERLNTFLAIEADAARRAADEADAALKRGEGEGRPLLGIPYALKDIFVTRALDDDGRPTAGGLPTTAGSRILSGYRSPYASSAQERLDAAGAILIGKTNCDEFAMGSSNENSAFGPVHNPWDETTVPGGSSGGSAAAVASGQALFALGTDTGGSIRQPASLTGTVGMKPTYGRVSRYGMVAFASSLDQCGPLAHSVRDVAIVLGALAGHDPRDSTSVDTPVPDYLEALTGDVRGLRLGVPREYFVAGMEPGVETAVRCRRRDAARARRRDRRREPAVHRPRTGHVLHHRAGRGEREPGALRRGPLRAQRWCRRAVGELRAHSRDRIRRRGEAADHARHVRPFRRLLRRVLREGPAGPHPHQGRVRRGAQHGRRHPRPDLARPSRSRSARRSTTRWRCT